MNRAISGSADIVPQTIRSLTGIRGLAALYVVVYHSIIFDNPNTRYNIIRHGYLAVDLFFVLSGFVMAMSYNRMFADGFDTRNYVVFLIRRLARVYPLYLLMTLLVGLLLPLVAPDQFRDFPPSWGVFIANLLMVQAWGLTGNVVASSWSISTEWAAYLVFPALAGLALFSRQVIVTITCAAALVLLLALSLAPTPSVRYWRSGPLDISWVGSLLPLVRCFAEFTLGLVAFAATGHSLVRSALRRWFVAAAVSAVVLGLLTLRGSDFAVVTLFPVLIVSLAVGQGPVQTVLGWGPVFILGEISYAIYLMHPESPFLARPLVGWMVPWVGLENARIAGAATVLLAGAWLLHVLVEKPARGAVRRLEGRSGLRAVLASEASGREHLGATASRSMQAD